MPVRINMLKPDLCGQCRMMVNSNIGKICCITKRQVAQHLLDEKCPLFPIGEVVATWEPETFPELDT